METIFEGLKLKLGRGIISRLQLFSIEEYMNGVGHKLFHVLFLFYKLILINYSINCSIVLFACSEKVFVGEIFWIFAL